MAKEVTAKAINLRGSARKTRAVAYTVKGMHTEEALNILKYMPRRAAGMVYKVVNSAVANAVHNENLDPKKLMIVDIRVNDAPMLKRFHAESKGRAHSIMKRNSHIIVTVSEESKSKKGTKVETVAVATDQDEIEKDMKPAATIVEQTEKKPAKAKITKSKKK